MLTRQRCSLTYLIPDVDVEPLAVHSEVDVILQLSLSQWPPGLEQGNNLRRQHPLQLPFALVEISNMERAA
jgi:hypothetical protein